MVKVFGFKRLFMAYKISTHLEWPKEFTEALEKSRVNLLSRWNYKPIIQDIVIDY